METADAPLAGRRIGITADRRWEEQASLFTKRGAEIVHGPSLATVDLSGEEPLRKVTAELVEDPPDWLVVTTGMGLRRWLDAAGGWGLDGPLKGALASATIVARGAKSASAVRHAGLELSWRAPKETMDEIVEHVADQPVPPTRLALQLFDPEAHPSTLALAAVAEELVEVPVYQWTLPADPGPAQLLIESTIAGEVDAVTFTSQPAVHHMFRLAERAGRAEGLRRALNGPVLAACVGPVCAEAAREEGIVGMVWPDPPRLSAMVRQVTQHLVEAGTGGGDS